jgi:hypothetical protein
MRLVEQRQVELGQVGDVDVELRVGAGPVGEPARDREPGAPGAGRGDDDEKAGHVCDPSR